MKFLRLSIAVTLALVVWSCANIMWSGSHHRGIVKADGKGYYGHLPALFIYHDLQFEFYDTAEMRHYYDHNYYYDYRSRLDNGTVVNKHFCGTALPMLPGFLVAHLYSKNSHYKADGFSKPYSVSVSISAILFMLLTFAALVKTLTLLGITRLWIGVVIPILVFGTNWYYYVVCEPSVSHVYSVFFITYFTYLGLRWGLHKDRKIILMATVLGLIVLIRPVNGLVVCMVPFFFSSFNHLKEEARLLLKSPLKLSFGIILFLSIISLQLILYKLQSGSFIVQSYKNESFDFLNPQIWNILLSYKKGLFLYTPIFLISLIGFYKYYKHDAWRAGNLMFVFAVFTYVVSSWWNWYYGGSFSSRVYLDFICLFAIPLAFLLQTTKNKWRKRTLVTVVVILTLFCQFQTFQYRKMIIHWDSMTKDTYWEVFMDFDVFKK